MSELGGDLMVKLFKVVISLPEFSVDVEAEDEDEARSRAEDFILRAMEKS
jgi:hypothetical protein